MRYHSEVKFLQPVSMNTSLIGGARHNGLQCNITDMFGWFLQVLLAALAFTCLICKLQTELLIVCRSVFTMTCVVFEKCYTLRSSICGKFCFMYT